MLRDGVQIFVEAALPMLLAIVTEILLLADSIEDSFTLGHHGSPPKRRLGTTRRGIIITRSMDEAAAEGNREDALGRTPDHSHPKWSGSP
jgi:hypothetical protein